MLSILTTFLKSGTFRRWALGLAGIVVLAVNSKLQLGLDDKTIAAIGVICAALILGSNYKEGTVAAASATATTTAHTGMLEQILSALGSDAAPAASTTAPTTPAQAAAVIAAVPKP